MDEVGNSEFIPNKKSALALMEKYGRSSVEYIKGEPDFSPFAKHNTPWGHIDSTVKIPHMTDQRNNPKWRYGRRPKGTSHDPNYEIGNYSQADNELLKKLISETQNSSLTIEDVVKFRKNNKLTWHESTDGTTMLLVHEEIHSACPHSGGVSEMSYQMKCGCVGDYGDDYY